LTRNTEAQAQLLNLQLSGRVREVEAGTLIIDLLGDLENNNQSPIMGAKYNNRIVDLYEEATESGTIEFIDLSCEDGLRIYRQSLVFLLSRAVYELYPNCKVLVKHSLSKNFYCEIEGVETVSPLNLQALEAKMREMIQADEPIIPQVLSKQRALKMLETFGHDEKVAL